MVDRGAETTWIDATVLEAIGIERRKDIQFQLANGQIVPRSVGYAVLRWIGRRPWTKSFSLRQAISNCSAHALWKV